MTRRLINADCEVDFVFIDGLELEQTWRKARQSEGTDASSFSCWSFYLKLWSQCGLVLALMTLELGLELPLKARTR